MESVLCLGGARRLFCKEPGGRSSSRCCLALYDRHQSYLQQRNLSDEVDTVTRSGNPIDRWNWITLALNCLLLCSVSGRAAVAQIDFARQIKPILAAHCVQCHGPQKHEAGLRLDTATTLLDGGERGPAVVRGKAPASLLIKAITGSDDAISKMPPEGPGLSSKELALLKAWIDEGATPPVDEVVEKPNIDHWSFRKPQRPALPELNGKHAVHQAIDLFILEKLAESNLTASPAAHRATLIRRLRLDLLGMPPTYRQVTNFVEDNRPDAYDRLIDSFLASPRYGERWGRHWLDNARYADSNGFTRDFSREMYRYREWVLDAYNRDLPFDQFIVEQIAGDLLQNPTPNQLIATGFHRNTLINEEGGTDDEQFRVDAVADRVATTGSVFLGLTVGCARCHDHKFDPLSQREYYEFFAFLNNCNEPTIEVPYDWQVRSGWITDRKQIRQRITELEQQLEQKADIFAKAQQTWEKALPPEERSKLPGPTQEALLTDLAKRTDEQKQLVVDVFKKSTEARSAFPEVDQINQLRRTEPVIPTTMVLQERGETRQAYIHRRGNFLDRGRNVRAGVPAALHPLQSKSDSPNRLDLAYWLASPENPLTPRVVMNRFWQRYFGRGIVETENDFGLQGSPPTHEKLLDWLATEWVRRRWSMKQMHRLIVTSATYRQSSKVRQDLLAVDTNNKLVARQSRVRIEAEIVRDNALAVAGLLSGIIGGPSVYPPQPEGVFEFTQDPKPWNTETGEGRFRRGMYTFFWRSSPYPSLMVFDFPNSNVTCTRRVRSNTPLQSLTLANDIQFVECARSLARRIQQESSPDFTAKTDFLFLATLARRPSTPERDALSRLFQQQQSAFAADPVARRQILGITEDSPESDADNRNDLAAWTAVARVILNLDEFITRE